MHSTAVRPALAAIALSGAAALFSCSTASARTEQASSNQGESYGAAPGERTLDIPFADLSGVRTTLHKVAGRKGTVLVTLDVECPVSQRYGPRLSQLIRTYKGQGYEFLIVDLTPHSIAQSRKAALAIPGSRTVRDDEGEFASGLRFESTAEAFVIDASGTLRYRGAIDDQYGISHQREKARSHWLADALQSVARGEDPHVRRTKADGCPLAPSRAASGATRAAPLTYHARVSRIFQSKCQTCHRAGGLAPMPLETYPQVFARRGVIDAMVSGNRMPPWSARQGVGHWANDRSLAASEKADLLSWIRSGAPEGDASHAPVPRRFASGWNIGKPDAVVPIPKPIRVPAEGPIAYQNVYAKTNFPEDRWISAMEIRPSQPQVVHHALAFLEGPDEKQRADGAFGFFAATVPGSVGIAYPEGTGKKLPRGAWIRFEIHYQPNGTEVVDRTQIGFRFASRPLRAVESLAAVNPDFTIPPQVPRHEVKAQYHFKVPGQLLSLFPHMHLRGSAFRFDLRHPDGKTVPLLDVPRFDFNWQSYYELRDPLEVPRGATLLATAWYDNSKGNPWNPDPTKTVRWGTETYEEMMIGYFDFIPEKRAANR